MFYTIFYQDSMVIYLGVVYEYKGVLVIIFDDCRDRSVERAPPGEEHGGEGATRRRARWRGCRQERSRIGYRRRERSWTRLVGERKRKINI
jgi:hypothetical protein